MQRGHPTCRARTVGPAEMQAALTSTGLRMAAGSNDMRCQRVQPATTWLAVRRLRACPIVSCNGRASPKHAVERLCRSRHEADTVQAERLEHGSCIHVYVCGPGRPLFALSGTSIVTEDMLACCRGINRPRSPKTLSVGAFQSALFGKVAVYAASGMFKVGVVKGWCETHATTWAPNVGCVCTLGRGALGHRGACSLKAHGKTHLVAPFQLKTTQKDLRTVGAVVCLDSSRHPPGSIHVLELAQLLLLMDTSANDTAHLHSHKFDRSLFPVSCDKASSGTCGVAQTDRRKLYVQHLWCAVGHPFGVWNAVCPMHGLLRWLRIPCTYTSACHPFVMQAGSYASRVAVTHDLHAKRGHLGYLKRLMRPVAAVLLSQQDVHNCLALPCEIERMSVPPTPPPGKLICLLAMSVLSMEFLTAAHCRSVDSSAHHAWKLGLFVVAGWVG
eukprot:365273-Chlamydomonas_euryale.AAC.16